MKAIVIFTVTREIEIPDDSLSLDVKRIVQNMSPEDLVVGSKMKTDEYVDVRLPHVSTLFSYR